MTTVTSIIQKNIPIAEVDKPVIIEFEFNTDGVPDSPNARIEAKVISDGIITKMSHPTGNPPSSIFVQSEDKKTASVISIKEKNTGAWAKNRSITLEFDSLPNGNQDYIVGTLYYYNSDDIVGPGIPLTVKVDSEDAYPRLIGAGVVSGLGLVPFNSFLLNQDLTLGHLYKVFFSDEIYRVLYCPENMSFDPDGLYCSIHNSSNVQFYGGGLGYFKALTSGSAEKVFSNRYALLGPSQTQSIDVTLWDYGLAGEDI